MTAIKARHYIKTGDKLLWMLAVAAADSFIQTWTVLTHSVVTCSNRSRLHKKWFNDTQLTTVFSRFRPFNGDLLGGIDALWIISFVRGQKIHWPVRFFQWESFWEPGKSCWRCWGRNKEVLNVLKRSNCFVPKIYFQKV